MTTDGTGLTDTRNDAREPLPLQTRVALWALLGAAVLVLFLVWDFGQRKASGAGSTPEASEPAAAPVPDPQPSPAAPSQAQPASTTKTETQPPLAAATALGEVETLMALVEQDGALEPARAAVRLRQYTDAADERVRAAATKALASLLGVLDASTRSVARAAAEKAEDLAADNDFAGALAELQQARAALPQDANWTKEGAPKLDALIEALGNCRNAARTAALAAAAEEWTAAQAGADSAPFAVTPRLAALLQHRDPTFRQDAGALKSKLEARHGAALAQRREQRQRESELRAAWLAFFGRFSAAIAEGNLENAEKMCKPAADDALLKGGVRDPAGTLQGCAQDVAGIRALQDAALEKARTDRRSVALAMRRGRVEGTLDGAEGRQLRVAIGGGGSVGVKVESLTAAGLAAIFEEKDLAAKNLAGALWAMSAYEAPGEAQTILEKAYGNLKQPVPAHWAARFALDAVKLGSDEARGKFDALADAVKSGDEGKVKAALEAACAAAKAIEMVGPLAPEQRDALAAAEKLLRTAKAARIVLQSGVSPAPEYNGLTTDQISQYRESANKTDVGVQYGLKLGAAGGLQRALIRADGLEAALGKARVKRATLELYQVESPQSAGATIGVFRLKRAWAQNAGTWMSFDSAKAAAWALPGASADADAEPKEDTALTLDAQKNVWRSWDVTVYVQDVLTGKAQNCGLLLRVTNGEPDYHVRFYPETDLERTKDEKLRPRLVLEVDAP